MGWTFFMIRLLRPRGKNPSGAWPIAGQWGAKATRRIPLAPGSGLC
jgi:hypothetical protein